jgi:hypothetical protein
MTNLILSNSVKRNIKQKIGEILNLSTDNLQIDIEHDYPKMIYFSNQDRFFLLKFMIFDRHEHR